MTLCIAAHANLHGFPRIILCFDSLVGDDYGTTESLFKCDLQFAPGLTAMFAGTLEDAEDAVRLYKERLAATPPTLGDIKEQLWVGMKELKAAISRHGKKRTDVQLIVAGFIEGKPRIFYTSQDAVATLPSFAAIGTGGPSADAILRWRKVNPNMWLDEAMYFVYEAKRFGETSPFVGQMTTMFVIESSEHRLGFDVHTILPKGLEFLSQQFDRFGPQPFVNEGKFPKEGFR